MKQQEVEELLRWVKKLEKAKAWLLGEKEAAENTSWVAARGGGHWRLLFFSYWTLNFIGLLSLFDHLMLIS
jgi:hypothetical protein